VKGSERRSGAGYKSGYPWGLNPVQGLETEYKNTSLIGPLDLLKGVVFLYFIFTWGLWNHIKDSEVGEED